MHIYLAGPITGFPDRNRNQFNKWADRLRLCGHKVFNPTTLPEDMKESKALAYELQYICLQDVEGVAFMPGWENSKGSRVEHALAVALNIRRIYLEEPNEKVFNPVDDCMPELSFCA